jgi:hypothetical protein
MRIRRLAKWSAPCLAAWATLFTPEQTFAQFGMSNARSLGMGSAYSAIARGVEAPSWNPANLGLSGRRKYNFNLFSLGFGLGNDSFNKKQYDLYNGAYLTSQDKQDILNAIPNEGMGFEVSSEVQALGLSVGSFAFTASGLVASDMRLSKDIVDLALNGNDVDRTYDIGATDGEGWGVSSFALSFGMPLTIAPFKEFSVGLSAKYLHGLAYGKVVEASSEVITNIDGLHADGQVIIDRSFGGSGFGLDLGVAANVTDHISIGASMANLIGKVNWTKDTKRFTYNFRADSISVQKLSDMDLDSAVVDTDEEVDIDPFSSSLPRHLRFGLARTGKRLSVGFDYLQGFGKGAGAGTKPLFSLGTELRLIPFLPLRTGVQLGGKSGFSTAAGFALDFSIFSWDFAVLSKGGMFGGNGLAFAFDWMFRF